MAFTERSEATRTAILGAARKLFAEQGFAGTTIRKVASLAGVDPSMVMRYYVNKEGLFRAAVDLRLNLEELPAPPRERLGEAMARHFLSRWEGDLSDEAIMLLLRSSSTNALAAQSMRDVFTSQVASFVGRALGCGPEEAARRAGLVSTQLLGLAFTRYVVRLPPVVAMSAEELARSVGPVVQHYLTGDLP
ncbi:MULTISPECIES: TetR/AcrR family transcriptional regulator [unclassified Nonomuraea]|uniref:TetR/AcrR family transcriptional regulator n=1 Tax=Nonomuraea sp. NPDC049725 TaxID=3154508 RepID=UPI00342FC44B